MHVCWAFSKDPTGLQSPTVSNAPLPPRAGTADDKTPAILRERPPDVNGFNAMKTLQVNLNKINKLPPLPGTVQPPDPVSVEDVEKPSSPLERQRTKKKPPPLPQMSEQARAANRLKSPPAKFPDRGFGLPSSILGSATKIHLHSCECEACVKARENGHKVFSCNHITRP